MISYRGTEERDNYEKKWEVPRKMKMKNNGKF